MGRAATVYIMRGSANTFAHGYLVGMLYHYRANTYDSTVMYTRSKLWRIWSGVKIKNYPQKFGPTILTA
jgi:hypothetical protein